MTFPQRVQRRLRQLHPQERGGFLVEALVVSVIVTVALLGTLSVFNISSQLRNRAGERSQLNDAIDADLAAIEDRAADLTCCTGVCRLGLAGVTTDNTAPFTQPCNTANRRDDRYFYPQLDSDPGTAGSEAETVDALCREPVRGIISDAVLIAFNTIPVNGALTTANHARTIVRLNSVQNQLGNQNILQVTYTDTNSGNAVVRVARVVPPMARFCP
ncbi:hypothetical protein KBY72_05135 [Cyanobium sp. BA5m-21]|uniref:type IV pilus modification PilV family protein n=1 Tax=unclassified Cyanobium TaxID=2627006 RepID=UPI0020CC8486|nr:MULTISPECIES: hypothetical protein [unclassified Cyanobium]MCP9903053.1 hypothetical protein [Cyanobium sp. BA5m-10]MCP9906563.1 hypothetical protein [Cyanobium sp. BA5m-21]